MSEQRQFPINPLLELFADPLDPGYGDAAQRRAAHGPRPPWRRRGALGLRILTLVVTGFLLAVAYREAVAAEPARTTARAGLIEEVKTARDRTDSLQDRLDQLRRDVAAAQEEALGGASAELNRIREQEAATGLAAVHGSGIVVRLADAPTPLDPTTGRPVEGDVSKVLDVDLHAVANGLWAAGAEAVAINGQRLTAISAIRKAGDAILIDRRPVTNPYEISAIGPDDLLERFTASAAAASMRGLVEQYGLGFGVSEADDLELPAAPEPALRYARPQATPNDPSPDVVSPTPSAGD